MIGVGIIGAGLSAKVFHAPFITKYPSLFNLLAFLRNSSSNPVQGFEQTPVLQDWNTFLSLPELSLVIVGTPPDTHYKYASEAMKAGKHVILEKPITVNSDEAYSLVAIAKENNVILAPFQNRRWDGDFLTVEKAIKEAKLGRVVEFISTFDRFKPIAKPSPWKDDDTRPGNGLLNDLGSHLVQQAVCLFGSKGHNGSNLKVCKQYIYIYIYIYS